MIDSFAGLFSSFGALQDITKSLLELRDFQQLNAKVIEFQQVILCAQQQAISANQSHAALAERIREIENECVRLKEWGAEKERYAIREIAPGVFAYLENGYVGKLQSAHKLCTNCFEQQQISLLQQVREEHRIVCLICHRCQSKVTSVIMQIKPESKTKIEPTGLGRPLRTLEIPRDTKNGGKR